MPSSYTIGGHFENFIKEQVEGGSYASASEVIRDGLRLLEEDQKRRQAVIDGLRGDIEKGRRSGKPKPAAELEGLVYGFTKLPSEGNLPLFQKPIFWAGVAMAALIVLQWIFW